MSDPLPLARWQRWSPLFLTLSLAGFGVQWIIMTANGSLYAMLLAAYRCVLPSGIALRPRWTGVWPVDFLVNLLLAFFVAVLDASSQPHLGAYLLLADLITAIHVCGLLVLVEDRRDRKSGPLRYPALWQALWAFFGAASILPQYMRLYTREHTVARPAVPAHQAQALPLTVLLSLGTVLALLAPARLGAGPLGVQVGVIAWLLGPAAVGLAQDRLSSLFAARRLFSSVNPVRLAYAVAGLVSAAVHMSLLAWITCSPHLTLVDVYWPVHDVLRTTPDLITGGATIFMQWGFLAVHASVLALGLWAWGCGSRVAQLGVRMLVAGPGGALAWFLCEQETLAAAQKEL